MIWDVLRKCTRLGNMNIHSFICSIVLINYMVYGQSFTRTPADTTTLYVEGCDIPLEWNYDIGAEDIVAISWYKSSNNHILQFDPSLDPPYQFVDSVYDDSKIIAFVSQEFNAGLLILNANEDDSMETFTVRVTYGLTYSFFEDADRTLNYTSWTDVEPTLTLRDEASDTEEQFTFDQSCPDDVNTPLNGHIKNKYIKAVSTPRIAQAITITSGDYSCSDTNNCIKPDNDANYTLDISIEYDGVKTMYLRMFAEIAEEDIIPPPWLHVGGIVSISFSCASLVAMIIVITVLAVKDKLKKLHLWICCGVCAGVIVIFMFVAGFTSNDADPQVETDNLIRSLSICAACLVGVIIVTIVTYFVYDWCPIQQNKKDQSSNRGQSASRSTGQVSPHFSNSESGDKTNGSGVVTPPSAMQPLAIMSTVAVASPRKLPPLNSAKSPDDPADDVEEEEQRKKKKKKKKRKHRDVEDGETMST